MLIFDPQDQEIRAVGLQWTYGYVSQSQKPRCVRTTRVSQYLTCADILVQGTECTIIAMRDRDAASTGEQSSYGVVRFDAVDDLPIRSERGPTRSSQSTTTRRDVMPDQYQSIEMERSNHEALFGIHQKYRYAPGMGDWV